MSLYRKLLSLLDGRPREEKIHSFLAENPCILKQSLFPNDDETTVRSKPSLHKCVPDFACGFRRATTGVWTWTLLELKRPEHSLLTQAGRPAATLNEALSQIDTWRIMIRGFATFARNELPDINEQFTGWVVIGRRKEVRTEHRRRLDMLQYSRNVRISSYDTLLDACKAIDSY